MKSRKPVAYIAPYITGHFCFEPIRSWIGKDAWGSAVGRGRTRRDCEADCRRNGYTPVRE